MIVIVIALMGLGTLRSAKSVVGFVVCCGVGFNSGSALAANEEIQVYMDEMLEPGQFGLDVHTNYVSAGRQTSDYAGQQQSLRRFRITPEFSLGLAPGFELGFYFPLATVDREGRFGIDGTKIRLKYLAPRAAEQPWFWGVNFEIGRVDRKLDVNPYNAEIKGILGMRSGRWTAAINTNIGFRVSGPVSAPPALEVATKIRYELTDGLEVGIESYNGTGELRRLGRMGDNEQSTFLVLEKNLGKWDLNVGVGRGYGSNPDRMIFKAIVGVPLD